MRAYLISDNTDTQMGMRLAGIEGVVVHTAQDVKKELEKAMEDTSVAVVLMTTKIIDLCRDDVYETKLRCAYPLIVEIPDRHASANISGTISKYVADAVGIRL